MTVTQHGAPAPLFAPPRNQWVRRAVALAAGLGICAAMPPWGWWPAAVVGIAVWAVLLDEPRWTRRFWIGALVGLGWFLPSTLWMVKFSPVGWPVGVSIWFPFLTGAGSALTPPGRGRFAGLTATLIASEWLRWHAPFGGVPLSMLAMTQGSGPLLPVARVAGSLGVSAVVAGAGAATGALLSGFRRAGAVAFAVVIAFAVLGTFAPRGERVAPFVVAAVQGGGPQETRSDTTDYTEVFNRHVAATSRIDGPVDLIVWPENIVNVRAFESSPERARLADLARRTGATVIAGIVEDGRDDRHFRNAVVAFGPTGEEVGRYDKVRRVPYGEYVPLRFLLEPLARGLLPPRDQEAGTGTNAISTPVGRVGVVISWEVFFPRRVRAAVQDGADVILNPTNGASYWLTQVQTQQIASSKLRAVESGRWLVQAAPTGFSAVVDPSGNVVHRTGIGEQALIQSDVELRRGRTIAVIVGDLPALVAAVGLLLLAYQLSGRLTRRGGRSDTVGEPVELPGHAGD